MRLLHDQPITSCIEHVSLTHIELPLKECHRGLKATGPGFRDTILVALHTHDGRVGVGECAPPPGPELKATIEQCWQELTATIPSLLLGQPVMDIETCEARLAHDNGLHRSSRAGVETAYWDLIGKFQERSLASLLGADEARLMMGIEPSVEIGPYPTMVDTIRAMEPHQEEGIRTFVIGLTPGLDLELMESLRNHFPDCQFAADAGGRFDRSQVSLFHRLDELDLLWIDDPLPAADTEGMAGLQAAMETPLCVDASQTHLLETGGCRLARLSVQGAGGLNAARRLHDICEANHVSCRVCTSPESGVGLAQSLALAALPNCKDPSGLAPLARWFADLFVKPPIELDDLLHGRLRVTSRPGLGHAVDWVRVHEHRVKHAEFPIQ